MKIKLILTSILLFISASLWAEPQTETTEPQLTAEEKEYYAWANELWDFA